MLSLFRKNIIYILSYILLVLPILFLIEENFLKCIILVFILTIWLVFILFSKERIFISLLFIFLVLPFNITFQLPESLNILGNIILISNPYVGGLFVNYLVPTLSILDIFVFLLTISNVLENRKSIKKLFTKWYVILFVFLSISNLFFVQEILSWIVTLRIMLYIFTLKLTLEYLLESKNIKDLLQSSYLKIPLLLTILIQGIIGILQFIRGTNLGLQSLGESKIVNGMLGSSYIDINGSIYLRAYGTFSHPNVLAGWLILMLFISYILYLKKKDTFYIFCILISSIFVLFTFSRICILIFLIFYLYLFIKYIISIKAIDSFIGLLFIRFINLFVGGDRSWEDRTTLYSKYWNIFKERYLLGTGLSNSLRFLDSDIPYTCGGQLLLQPVHNVFMLSIVELGILNGIFFWIINYLLFIKGIKWNTFKVLIILVLIFIGLFDHYYLSIPQGNIIFLSFLTLLAY